MIMVIFVFLSTEPCHGGDCVGAVYCDPTEGESICPKLHQICSYFLFDKRCDSIITVTPCVLSDLTLEQELYLYLLYFKLYIYSCGALIAHITDIWSSFPSLRIKISYNAANAIIL